MLHQPQNKKSGFTLLEMIISAGLLAVLLGLTSTILTAVGHESRLALKYQQIFYDQNMTTTQLAKEIRNGLALLPESTNTRLVLLNSDNKKIEFEMISQRLRQKLGNSYHYLTEANAVKEVRFNYEGGLVNYRVVLFDDSVISRNIFPRSF
ncbi:MAG: prepilin-type N-terminal cleavage/methylation domain-containing protein [Candidatus Margulisiibacteriota bacterium]|jgi:prepilin-type N-terminal cleavage/methylation domain-containing protein